MSGLFTRILRLGKAEAHSAVDKFEDPIKMTEQGIRELKKDLEESMKSLAQVKSIVIRMRNDAENKKNQEISFNNILNISFEEKVWGSVLFLEILEDDKKKKYQFSIVQDWVKYPLSAPTKYMKVDWSGFVKYIKDKQLVTR